MADLTVQQSDLDGVSPTFATADAGGDSFDNNGRTYIHVKNGDASQHTVTVDSQTECSQGFDHDAVVNVSASGEEVIGPFSTSRFNDANGKVQISYDDVTSVTIAVVSL